MRMSAPPIALSTRPVSQYATEPGNRTTLSLRTIAVISSTDGNPTPDHSPASPSRTASFPDGDLA